MSKPLGRLSTLEGKNLQRRLEAARLGLCGGVLTQNLREGAFLRVDGGFVGPDSTLTKLSFAFQIPYIETSAKDPPLNVDNAFHDLVRVIR